jgi:hypothetical protein
MYGCSDYLVAFTPRQEILIYQLHCEQLLLTGLLSPQGFWVQHGALDMRCANVASGLPLPIVPPIVELVPQSVLRRLSRSEVLC